jgi:hypothetical protein
MLCEGYTKSNYDNLFWIRHCIESQKFSEAVANSEQIILRELIKDITQIIFTEFKLWYSWFDMQTLVLHTIMLFLFEAVNWQGGCYMYMCQGF